MPALSADPSSPVECQHCGRELEVMQWNGKVGILYCDHVFCPLYRQPQGRAPTTKERKEWWREERRKQGRLKYSRGRDRRKKGVFA